jgi:L-threonylcarbamoyladenylate synthase
MNVYEKFTEEVIEKLKSGAIAVIPTDTQYGLVVAAKNKEAVERLYVLKKRENKPGTLIAASIDDLTSLGVKRRYLTAVEHLWPNPLSIVLPVGDDLMYLHRSKRSLAVRIPDNEQIQKVLRKTGPLMTSSANHPGEPPAQTIEAAQNYFGEEVDLYVDGGNLGDKKPSTVIRVVDDAIEVLRPGAIDIDENGRIHTQ